MIRFFNSINNRLNKSINKARFYAHEHTPNEVFINQGRWGISIFSIKLKKDIIVSISTKFGD